MSGRVIAVIVHWQDPDDTLGCVESLAGEPGVETIVVDNGSREPVGPLLSARAPGVTCLHSARNLGYAGGANLGIRAALERGAEVVLLLNNDVRVRPGAVAAALRVLDADPRVAVVGAKVLTREDPGRLWLAWGRVTWRQSLVALEGADEPDGPRFARERDVEWIGGCSMWFRAAALRRIGLLDEEFFAYHEEVDWCFRARQAGYEIWYQPLARIWHYGSRSTNDTGRPAPSPRTPALPQLENPMPLTWNPVRTYLGARNAVRFVRAHGTLRQKLYWACSTLYAMPLAYLAAVLDGEEELMLGFWTYRRALVVACVGRTGGSPVGRFLRTLLRTPMVLLWSLPRTVAEARREGRTAQVAEHMQGLVDGFRNRPVPLERLGLR